ncbi:Putative signal transducing protein [Pedobacter westerhofensis]|uniref:Signal transducing protein n=1 Tax=Pedobacter westerhofensis TaxID=425512 RepID=A0A521BC32_9SPHI|nr:DUF2007 domain-containing protein [Pedobacter westerhofensis]SMO44627.1 Putative signal transducing protein [Pedobacter westerhofensis]
MNNKIIWYRTFYNPIEANIVRARLEDSGFKCFLQDENISTIQPLYNQAVGGVKLMVFEKDAPQIDLLLSEENLGDTDEFKPQENSPVNDNEITCKKCGSTNVGFGQATKSRYSWIVLLVSFCLAVFPFMVKKCYHCYNCGHEFH